MHAYHGTDPRRPAPLILGHEAAGHIVGGARDGERVTVNPLVGCGTCKFCKVGRDNICQSRQLTLEKAAMAEPLAVSWHAARLGVEALQPVLGGGAIGVASALCLKAQGIEDITIVEPNEMRAAFLKEKLEFPVQTSASGQFGIVVDAVGYDATRAAASEAAEAGGVILHIGSWSRNRRA